MNFPQNITIELATKHPQLLKTEAGKLTQVQHQRLNTFLAAGAGGANPAIGKLRKRLTKAGATDFAGRPHRAQLQQPH